jgi:hypothetical protein
LCTFARCFALWLSSLNNILDHAPERCKWTTSAYISRKVVRRRKGAAALWNRQRWNHSRGGDITNCAHRSTGKCSCLLAYEYRKSVFISSIQARDPSEQQQEPRGFDRLRALGFSEDEIQHFRWQLYANADVIQQQQQQQQQQQRQQGQAADQNQADYRDLEEQVLNDRFDEISAALINLTF